MARIEILGGGEVDDAELAALVIALTPVAVPTGRDDHGRDALPPWARAGLLENIGGRRPSRPSDLRAPFTVD
jgi:hypothetical protein